MYKMYMKLSEIDHLYIHVYILKGQTCDKHIRDWKDFLLHLMSQVMKKLVFFVTDLLRQKRFVRSVPVSEAIQTHACSVNSSL